MLKLTVNNFVCGCGRVYRQIRIWPLHCSCRREYTAPDAEPIGSDLLTRAEVLDKIAARNPPRVSACKLRRQRDADK